MDPEGPAAWKREENFDNYAVVKIKYEECDEEGNRE